MLAQEATHLLLVFIAKFLRPLEQFLAGVEVELFSFDRHNLSELPL